MTKRHLAIGDIHGCSAALNLLLEKVQPSRDDMLITLGDHINRGTDSYSVIERLLEVAAVCTLHSLRGNHELMLLSAKEDPSRFNTFLRVGGDKTLESYRKGGCFGDFPNLIPEDHWFFFEQRLLPWFEIESHFFVHANAYPDFALEDQPDFMLYWEKWNNPAKHESGKTMVCGHTSQKSGLPLQNGNAICLDTWAYGDGWLSCLHLESGKVWQANERGDSRTIWLDELPC